MPNKAVLTHLLAKSCPRYAAASIKGRDKYGLGGFSYSLIPDPVVVLDLDEVADFWVDFVVSYLVR